MKPENQIEPKELTRLAHYLESNKDADPKDQTPKELFAQVSNISLCMSYDLIDKIRYWEKETLAMPEEDIKKRIPHIAKCLERLKVAYLEFSDTDL